MNPAILEDLKGKFEGVGMSVRLADNGYVHIMHPTAGLFIVDSASTAYAFLLGYKVGRAMRLVQA